jgi:hypothetical protein
VPPLPVAAEVGAGASAPEPARPPFIALIEDFPDLFQKEVLERLDLVDRGLLGRTGSAVRSAVKRSNLPRVGGSAEERRVGIVRFCRSLSTFSWAVANGCQWQLETTCENLAGGGHLGGHLEVLRWAREHGCGWDEWTCARAAADGHLEVLKWAREHHCPWHEDLDDEDVDCCLLAAQGGHLEVLKWLREHDCPWSESTACMYAASDGQLEILKWARSQAGAYTRPPFGST